MKELFNLDHIDLGLCGCTVYCGMTPYHKIYFSARTSNRFNEDFVQYVLAYNYELERVHIDSSYTIDQIRLIVYLIKLKKLNSVKLLGDLSYIPYDVMNEVLRVNFPLFANFSHNDYKKLNLNPIKDSRFVYDLYISKANSVESLKPAIHFIANTKIYELKIYCTGNEDMVCSSLRFMIEISNITNLIIYSSKKYNISDFVINIINQNRSLRFVHVPRLNTENMSEDVITNIRIQHIMYSKFVKKVGIFNKFERVKFPLTRNVTIQETITKIICLIILSNRETNSLISTLPKDVALIIANLIHQSRSDTIWIQAIPGCSQTLNV